MGERALSRAVLGLGLIGLAIATYLTYVHYAGLDPACSTGGCEKVQASDYSEVRGVPVALIGLIGYVLILGSLFVPGEIGRTATVLLVLTGFGYSAYLTYLELFEINAICQWCVGSAVVLTLLVPFSVLRLLRYSPPRDGE